MTEARSQEIEVGPVRVDTGSDWLDILFVMAILLFLAILSRRLGR